MTTLVAATLLGFLLALRCGIAIWFVGGVVLAALAFFAAPTLGAAALETPLMITAYNLGLFAGIVALDRAPSLRPAALRARNNRPRS